MTERGVESLKADHQEVLTIAKSLSEDEWMAASGCEGWRTKDVVAHLACTFRSVVEPGTLPPGVTGDLEATQEVGVAERKDWDPARVVAEYEDLGSRALEALAGLQTPGVAETVIPLEDAGQYPLHLVANALASPHRHLGAAFAHTPTWWWIVVGEIVGADLHERVRFADAA